MNRRQAFVPFAILLVPFAFGCGRSQEKSQLTPALKDITQPPRDVKVTQGFVVQPLSPNSVRIHWSTNVVAEGLLRYGTRADRLDEVATDTWAGVTHRVILRNLTPNTTYYYRVSTSSPQNTEPMSGAATFRTQSEKRAP